MGSKNVSSLSKSKNLEEMAEFWETHSLADYADEIHEVDMTFAPSARRTTIRVDPDLLADLRRIAKERRMSTQTLVNLWLSQRVAELKAQTL